MSDIFYYNEDTDEMLEISELTNAELIRLTADVEQEAHLRVYEELPAFEAETRFEAEISADLYGADLLRFRLLFKNWAGIVPRRIGVRI